MEAASWVLVGVTGALAIMTGIYACMTHKILLETRRQTKLMPNPVLAIHLHALEMEEGPDGSARNLAIHFDLSNKGNAPAIDVSTDAEIVLHYTYRNGQQELPAHSAGGRIAFIGTKKRDSVAALDPKEYPRFGPITLDHLRREFLKRAELASKGQDTGSNPIKYEPPILRIHAYYRNNLQQYFKSLYEAYLDASMAPGGQRITDLSPAKSPAPTFSAYTVSKQDMDKELSGRNQKRRLGD